MDNKAKILKILNNKENKKVLWNTEFENKVLGRKTTLGGIGPKALTIKLESSKAYKHLDIKCFLNWEKIEEFTPEEWELINFLLSKI